MDVERARGSATRHATPTVVAAPDEPPHGRRDVLDGPRRRIAVDRADALGVALGALDRGRSDRDRRAGTVLPALFASAADDHRDLGARTAARLAARAVQ